MSFHLYIRKKRQVKIQKSTKKYRGVFVTDGFRNLEDGLPLFLGDNETVNEQINAMRSVGASCISRYQFEISFLGFTQAMSFYDPDSEILNESQVCFKDEWNIPK